MERKKYQMLGKDEPFTLEDGREEVKGFKELKPCMTWQTGVVCYSGYPIGNKKVIFNGYEYKSKLRVLTFSVN